MSAIRSHLSERMGGTGVSPVHSTWQLRRVASRQCDSFSNLNRGISLLEVLIAIFVTAVGLLGVAALIPVGTFQVGEANKSVRGWDLGQAAIRQMDVQKMLDSANWTDAMGLNLVAANWDSAFVIDPYFFAYNGGVYAVNQDRTVGRTDQRYWFPYQSADDVNQTGTPAPYQIQRFCLRAWPGGPAMMGEPFDDQDGNRVHNGGEPYNALDINNRWDNRGNIAERLFSGHDDAVFTAPSDEQQRPFPVNMVEPYTDSDTDGVYDFGEPFVDLNGDGVWNDQASALPTAGDYSWFITISPANYPTDTGSYIVSVVVCYKRATNFAPAAETPGERTVWADVEQDGRHALLYYTQGAETDYLNLKSGSWLALTGITTAMDMTQVPPVSGFKKHIRWFRVTSVGEPEDDPLGAGLMRRRRVTLDGPDLITSLFTDFNAATPDLEPTRTNLDLPTFHATIVTGVVNVFERTIERN